MDSTYILGLNLSHDRSACLLKNGVPIVAIEEERLDRWKHSHIIDKQGRLHYSLPNKAIQYCLNTENIPLSKVKLIVASNASVILINKNSKRVKLTPKMISKQLPTFSLKKIVIINHHLSHAASVYYTSPFKEAAIMVNDGNGNKIKHDLFERTTLYYAKKNKIQLINKICGKNDENSLGAFYKLVTKYFLGWGFGEEGKTMALASFGTSNLNRIFDKIFVFAKDGKFKSNPSKYFSRYPKNKDKYIFKGKERKNLAEPLNSIHKDVAYSCQYITEKAIKHLANFLKNKTKSKNLCISGGVALNSVANSKLRQAQIFENLFIMPAAGDNGCAIGNALYGWINILNKKRVYAMRKPYLGRKYSKKEILHALKRQSRIEYEQIPQIEIKVAELLSKGKIIGWFQGGSETGPRALGHRSILCDPRKKEMKYILNEKVKHRESFRPFAPSILEECAQEYFDINYSPFMLFAENTLKPEKIPATVHVDNTARIQTVNKKDNDRFYVLIKEFEKLTGVPVLLNTSFNDSNEPIVESPDDAINCYLSTRIDNLVIDNYLIWKKPNYNKISFSKKVLHKPIVNKTLVLDHFSNMKPYLNQVSLKKIGVLIKLQTLKENFKTIENIITLLQQYGATIELVFPLEDLMTNTVQVKILKNRIGSTFKINLSNAIKFVGTSIGYSLPLNKSFQQYDYIIPITNKSDAVKSKYPLCEFIIAEDVKKFIGKDNQCNYDSLCNDFKKNINILFTLKLTNEKIIISP